jgi:choline dehydrogenase-like flavoprotein
MSKENLIADVVIVGSGAGGAAVAGPLLADGLRVTVIEAGGLARAPAGSHVRNAIPREDDLPAVGSLLDEALEFPGNAKHPPGDLTEMKVIYGVGGMFSYWTCNCPTPHPAELSSCLPDTTWESLFGRVRALLGINIEFGRDSLRQERIIARVRDVVGPLGAGRAVQPMPVAIQVDDAGAAQFASSDTLFGPSARDGKFTLLPDMVAREVLHEGRRATGVKAYPRAGGQPTIIAANAVVAAGGTAGTPQLLVASGVDAGPALGRGIFDHPAIGSRVVLRSEILDGVGTDDPLFNVWVPFAPDRPWHNQIVRFPANPGPLAFDVGLREIADVFTFASMDVVPENCFEFNHDRPDRLGLPTIHAHYRLSRDDHRRIAHGLDEHFRIASTIGDVEAYRWVPVFYGPGWSTHMMGGCGMGASDDDTSVVDPNGRLWGYDNLYVAGNSVHSTSNAGNPTSITIAFALNTADAILAARS